MINTQLEFEGKIPTVQSCCTDKELQKTFKFQGQFDLEGQAQGHQFSNPSEKFRCLINSSSKKVKVVQCLTVKIKILEV